MQCDTTTTITPPLQAMPAAGESFRRRRTGVFCFSRRRGNCRMAAECGSSRGSTIIVHCAGGLPPACRAGYRTKRAWNALPLISPSGVMVLAMDRVWHEAALDTVRPVPSGDRPLAGSRGQLQDHIALSVANLDAWIDKLRGEGIKFLEEPYELGDTRAVMIEGPSREALELVEVR